MPWMKMLHITAVIVWCGALLYLPAAIATARVAAPPALFDGAGQRLLRGVFTLVATPAALVAIGSGTAIFVLQGPIVPWLVAKLAAVALLVLGHAGCGMLILRVERGGFAHLRGWSMAIAGSTLLWLATIAWLVLGKPF